jgi:hypothetical protein
MLLTAAVLAAVFLLLAATLPPSPGGTVGDVDDAIRRRTIAGAFHVHSLRSDGAGDTDAIAAAAQRAGLQFVVMTDHGDGTRQPEAPAYIHDVLVVDAVEISTNGGHYIALDMPASPYPLGGDAGSVVEDVRRLGGFGVVAHPDSARAELSWIDWSAPVDGLEWLSLDSEWRNESRLRLAQAAFDYMIRPGPALAAILDRPVSTLTRWDGLAARARVVALAGHDAHGGTTQALDDGSRRPALGVPSYEASFRAFATRAILSQERTGNADQDSRLLLDAIRAGRVFTAIDAVAGPAWLDYRADLGGTQASMGEEVPFAGGIRLSVRSTLPAGGSLVLLRNGVEVDESASPEFSTVAAGPGAYRVEARAPRSPGTPPVPWLVSNPIYLTVSSGEQASTVSVEKVLDVHTPARIEKDSGSFATLFEADGRRTLEFRLRGWDRAGQYVALVFPLTRPGPQADRLLFSARSSGPMRMSVQLRFDDRGGERWGRSVYLPTDSSQHAVTLESLTPVGHRSSRPDFGEASSLLFVVDLTNARPGTTGTIEVSDISFARAASTR